MRGKKMPQIGRIEVSVIEEEQSRWLAFQRGEIDFIDRFGSFAPIAIPDNKLAPDLAARGIYWDRSIEPEITYYFFNMKDPVVGGYTKERVALRRALILSYDIQQEIKVIRKNQAVADTGPIPAGVVGYDPKYRNVNQYDPALANKLLDAVGYKKGPDGYRTDPSGKPVTIVLTSEPQAISREYDELWKKSLDAIGVRFEARKSPFSDNIKAGEACQLDDVGLGVARRLSGRRELHAAPLRPQHAPEQSRVLRVEGVRRDVRQDQEHAEFAGARPASSARCRGRWKSTACGRWACRAIATCSSIRRCGVIGITRSWTAIWPYLDIDNAKRRK